MAFLCFCFSIFQVYNHKFSMWCHTFAYFCIVQFLQKRQKNNTSKWLLCMFISMAVFWPVSLIVVFIFIHADQLVGTGLISQKAQVFQGWRHFHQMLQQGLDVGEVSRGRGQGIQAVNYISIYSALYPGLASQHNSVKFTETLWRSSIGIMLENTKSG